jgi:chromosome segregation ATPase
MEGKEIIWVETGFAKKYNQLKSDEEKHKAFDEYVEKVSEESKREFKANLDSLDEDVAIYAGLMLKAKQSFEKAKNEQLSASYALWEGFEKELPSVREKIAQITNTIKPLTAELKQIDDLLKSINTYSVERITGVIEKFTNLSGKNKEMFDFLIKHFDK